MLPAFQVTDETNNAEVVRKFYYPKVKGQFFLNDPNGTKHLIQVEEDQNPHSKNFGRDFLAIKPGARWNRVGYFGQNKDRVWVRIFGQYKAELAGTETEIERIVNAFTECASAENMGVWEDYSLEMIPYGEWKNKRTGDNDSNND